MQTYTGRAFHPLTATEGDVDIEDVAHALSMICRYGGHARYFYSVAEHCLLLSHTVDPENALWALLHDATEAYVGDMVRPLKEEMPNYRRIEDRLMSVIAAKYGLPDEMPAQVKEHDRRILLDEKAVLMAHTSLTWDGLEGCTPLNVFISGRSSYAASQMYLARFHQLTDI